MKTQKQFLGIIDPNQIVNGMIVANKGDTFLTESIDQKGFAAYSYEPGCRENQGEWNNFRLLGRGMKDKCMAGAEEFLKNKLTFK